MYTFKEAINKQVRLNLAYAESLMLKCNDPKTRNEILDKLNEAKSLVQEDRICSPFEWMVSLAIVDALIVAQEDELFKFNFDQFNN